ncbi:rust resistance kinase Lr10-like [Macadamia integrifolia]|uniref:rust resistance kinase Lr10-like n=1 Tax=Macadamia integrifolia TaxID=60698 RepID=UPI001C50191D|nr:rust resistance kinase Lr10-like [Macadamia integrifolia]
MMGSPSLSFHAFVLVFPFFLLVSSQLSLASVEEENLIQRCASFQSKCGELNISYPFAKPPEVDCGLGIINCAEDSKPQLDIYMEDPQMLQVKNISYTEKTILIQDLNFMNLLKLNRCNDLYNFTTSLVSRNLSFRLKTPFLYFGICEADPKLSPGEHVTGDELRGVRRCESYDLHFSNKSNSTNLQSARRRFKFPVDLSGEDNDLLLRLYNGFSLQWELPQQCPKCDTNGTLCLREQNEGLFFCVDPNQVTVAGNGKLKRIIITAIVSSFMLVITLMAILVSFWKKRKRNIHNYDDFLKNYGSMAPKRYSYSNIKKMTNSFQEKLGQGGYGGVFKGKLPDGRLVAVKVLNASKGNGEEFINEVASISRTSHVHIVTLLGFCFNGSKRALIYEFMSNGSLEKFIYNKKSIKTFPHLSWDKLHQIAVGVAKGLEYLHGGCNTRILHFDIKPHNILLDEDFFPKISDFGLAKLCPRKDSIISMADARGTIGYIAPEVFSRNFGGVSHKSDVYSYGMMILEMVGGRRNIDARANHTSEIYFPDWIYKHIEQSEHLPLDMVMGEDEEEIVRKMVLVGLWCIQMDPTNRPSIKKVVDMLEGNLESLPIPPKPFLSSPPRQLVDSFTSSVS